MFCRGWRCISFWIFVSFPPSFFSMSGCQGHRGDDCDSRCFWFLCVTCRCLQTGRKSSGVRWRPGGEATPNALPCETLLTAAIRYGQRPSRSIRWTLVQRKASVRMRLDFFNPEMVQSAERFLVVDALTGSRKVLEHAVSLYSFV